MHPHVTDCYHSHFYTHDCTFLQEQQLMLQVIWMDALFGLCRKKAAGSSVRGPLNAGTVFDDQSQVNTFIDNYKPEKDATDFNYHATMVPW